MDDFSVTFDTAVDGSWAGLAGAPSDEMYERNLAAFERFQPQMHAALKTFKPQSELFFTDGDPNVRFQGMELYRKGAITDTRAALDDYWRQPFRTQMSPPDSSNIDAHANDLVFGVMKHCLQRGISFTSQLRNPQAYFFCCFGVGLAPHLNEIVETTDCRFLLLVEPNYELIHHSLFIFDWDEFFERAREADTIVEFLMSSEPKLIADTVGSRIRGENPAALDGTYFFSHYANATFEAARKHLARELGIAVAGLGFLADEVLMMGNVFRNFESGNARVFTAAPNRQRALPCLVVANGPSLDRAFEALKEIQDKAVIVAAGSALEPLLIHGIKPHFHVLVENDPGQRELYQRFFSEYDLSDVTLVASSTVPRSTVELYDRHILFFRPALSPTPAFMYDTRQCMTGCDPAVSNAAAAFSVQMGFRRIYFVGNDLGKPVGAHHHSTFSTIPPEDIEETRAYSYEVRGNFGGVCYSDSFFDWVRLYLERLLTAFGGGRTFYNCSEGVAIRYTIPKRITSLKLPDPPVSPWQVSADIVEECPVYSRDRFVQVWRKLDFSNAARKYLDGVNACVAEAETLADRRYLRRAMGHLHPGRNIDALATFYRGSLYQMFMAMHYYTLRLQDPDRQEEYDAIWRDEFARTVTNLAEVAVGLADELEAESGLQA